jgi:putative endonuclease
MAFFVYIMTNRQHGTLYVGQTDDIARRAHEHRNGHADGFTKEHNLHRLVFVEVHESREAARHREHQIKNWRRAWKVALIEETNPQWNDLFDTLQ